MILIKILRGIVELFTGGIVAIARILTRRPSVPAGAAKISHDRGFRIILCLSFPADAAFGFFLNVLTSRFAPLLAPEMRILSVILLLFPLMLAAQLQAEPHYATCDGVTVRAIGRTWFIPAAWISKATWAPRDLSSFKGEADVAVLAGGTDVRLDLHSPQTLPDRAGPVRQIWFGADDRESVDRIRELCLPAG